MVPCGAGIPFRNSDGSEANQGMLTVLLQCTHTLHPILVVCLHLKAKSGAQCEAIRHEQACQALHLADGLVERASADSSSPCSMLICGDFNDTPTSKCLQVLRRSDFVLKIKLSSFGML